jgi:hypothetical protein
MIDGQEVGSALVVRNQDSIRAYAVANASSAQIAVDGGKTTAIRLETLPTLLAGYTEEIVSLTLTNETERRAAPVTSQYRIQFRVANAQALKTIEMAFYKNVMSHTLNLATIRHFLESCEGVGPAKDYAEGVAKYLTAILVKERPADQSIATPIARYRELFGSSLQVLSSYSRPLARSLTAIAQFAINDFPARQIVTGFEELDLAMAFFRGPMSAQPYVPRDTLSKRRNAYPIDHGTARVLELCARYAGLDRWGPVLEEECRQITDSNTLDIMDRDKTLAIWALTALRLGVTRDAIMPLKRLSATYPFSKWAGPCLEEISK